MPIYYRVKGCMLVAYKAQPCTLSRQNTRVKEERGCCFRSCHTLASLQPRMGISYGGTKEVPLMATDLDFSDPNSCDLKSDTTWETLYRFLTRRVRVWIQSSHVSLWYGQEEDIVADIVQETVVRTF